MLAQLLVSRENRRTDELWRASRPMLFSFNFVSTIRLAAARSACESPSQYDDRDNPQRDPPEIRGRAGSCNIARAIRDGEGAGPAASSSVLNGASAGSSAGTLSPV